MSIVEILRKEIIDSGSPLANHSLNQGRLKLLNDGEKKLQPPKKALRSETRRDRLAAETEDWKNAKQSRILQRVVATLNGYEGFSPEILKREIGYLSRLGTVVEIIANDSQL